MLHLASWVSAVLLAVGVATEIRAATIPSAQSARVEVSQLLSGPGPTRLTSDADGPLELSVGENTGIEATLFTNPPSPTAPFTGTAGTIFVQANSVLVGESSASVQYVYEFSLEQNAELQFLRLSTGVPMGGTAAFVLEKDGQPLYELVDTSFVTGNEPLLAGDYRLVVEASAAASATLAREFTSVQIDFNLIFFPAPEPSASLLAAVCSVGFMLRRPC